MNLNSDQLHRLCDIAKMAATKAADVINSYTGKQLLVLKKSGGDSIASQVVTKVDFKSQETVLAILTPTLKDYDLAMLTEETEDDKSRLNKDYFWCIDPLDGTLPFTESKPGYAVSIALLSKSGEPQIGVVCDPVTMNLYSAIKGKGVHKNNSYWKVRRDNSLALNLYYNRSFKQLNNYNAIIQKLTIVVEKLNLKTLNLIQAGGAVMNACLAMENAPSCYIAFPKKKEGGGSFWDYAATACIYKEMGAWVSDIYGKPLSLNSPTSTFMNSKGILYATDSKIAEQIQKLYMSRMKG